MSTSNVKEQYAHATISEETYFAHQQGERQASRNSW